MMGASIFRTSIFKTSMALLVLALAFISMDAASSARAQVNFDRIGGDYLRSPIRSGDPADCAMICERDKR